jgi:hypothetical protein
VYTVYIERYLYIAIWYRMAVGGFRGIPFSCQKRNEEEEKKPRPISPVVFLVFSGQVV